MNTSAKIAELNEYEKYNVSFLPEKQVDIMDQLCFQAEHEVSQKVANTMLASFSKGN